VHEPFWKYGVHGIEHRNDCQGNMAGAISLPRQFGRKQPVLSLDRLLILYPQGLPSASGRDHVHGATANRKEEFDSHGLLLLQAAI
jgi:hypothetical protein